MHHRMKSLACVSAAMILALGVSACGDANAGGNAEAAAKAKKETGDRLAK
jgi:predicted NAD/FAD-dependent oxidoreductase